MNKNILKNLGFHKELENVESNRCPACNSPVTEFRDSISEREYKISGLCQKCQDEVFGK